MLPPRKLVVRQVKYIKKIQVIKKCRKENFGEPYLSLNKMKLSIRNKSSVETLTKEKDSKELLYLLYLYIFPYILIYIQFIFIFKSVIQNHHRIQTRILVIAFVDFKTTFDSVNNLLLCNKIKDRKTISKFLNTKNIRY